MRIRSYHYLILLPPLYAATPACADEVKAKTNFDEVIYDWSRTFAEVVQTTNQKHYKVTNPENCMIKAIDGFLTCLDPHSNFLDPKTYKSILESTSGEFFGIGIVIDNTRQPKDKFLMVIDTVLGGPADNAGVKPLDKIIEIDGKPLEGMSTEEATAKLKGERHSSVHIKVLRENSPDLLSFDITRDVIKEQNSLCFYLPDQQIYYLSLSMFTDTATKQIKDLLHQTRKKQCRALILDLRNNSGGLLNAAIDIAGLFIDKGNVVVTTKDNHHKETERYVTTTDPIANNTLPLFILINNYSASAAEILAGCLKIHSENYAKKSGAQKKLMVFLVGTRTFGKGSVQEVIPIGNNCAMKLTTSLYFLPNDTSIQGLGIEPDFEIEKRFPPTNQITWFTKFYGRERTLENYININGTSDEDEKKEAKATKEKTWSDRAKDLLDNDNQFRDTITLINLLSTAKTHCPEQVSNREKAVKFIKGIYVTNDVLKIEEIKS
jgi:carboxyl-terminal processing protease